MIMIFIIIGEPMHTASKQWHCEAPNCKMLHCLLYLVIKDLSLLGGTYQLEIVTPLRGYKHLDKLHPEEKGWLCSTCYAAVQIKGKKYYHHSSYYENYGWFLLQMEAITCLPQLTLCCEQRWLEHKGGHW